jgi:hypothetical protein
MPAAGELVGVMVLTRLQRRRGSAVFPWLSRPEVQPSFRKTVVPPGFSGPAGGPDQPIGFNIGRSRSRGYDLQFRPSGGPVGRPLYPGLNCQNLPEGSPSHRSQMLSGLLRKT